MMSMRCRWSSSMMPLSTDISRRQRIGSITIVSSVSTARAAHVSGKRVYPGRVTRHEIPTPALLLDAARFERNLARMAEHVTRTGKKLRPHAKTHRCPEIARRQIAAGALGVACAKLGEAEVMAAAGIRGLLITTEVVTPAKIER